jgi:hypothetical protein
MMELGLQGLVDRWAHSQFGNLHTVDQGGPTALLRHLVKKDALLLLFEMWGVFFLIPCGRA